MDNDQQQVSLGLSENGTVDDATARDRPAPPSFRYHPDPIHTGHLVPSDDPCESCDQVRGWRYDGPISAVAEIENLCPWCIANGSAAAKFEATFTDDLHVPAGVPADVVDVIATRTIGFSGWQQERWQYHCDDAAAFLGRAGWPKVAGLPDALESLRLDIAGPGWSAEQIEDYLRSLDDEGQPTAYLFRCLACGTHLAYSDFT